MDKPLEESEWYDAPEAVIRHEEAIPVLIPKRTYAVLEEISLRENRPVGVLVLHWIDGKIEEILAWHKTMEASQYACEYPYSQIDLCGDPAHGFICHNGEMAYPYCANHFRASGYLGGQTHPIELDEYLVRRVMYS